MRKRYTGSLLATWADDFTVTSRKSQSLSTPAGWISRSSIWPCPDFSVRSSRWVSSRIRILLHRRINGINLSTMLRLSRWRETWTKSLSFFSKIIIRRCRLPSRVVVWWSDLWRMGATISPLHLHSLTNFRTGATAGSYLNPSAHLSIKKSLRASPSVSYNLEPASTYSSNDLLSWCNPTIWAAIWLGSESADENETVL